MIRDTVVEILSAIHESRQCAHAMLHLRLTRDSHASTDPSCAKSDSCGTDPLLCLSVSVLLGVLDSPTPTLEAEKAIRDRCKSPYAILQCAAMAQCPSPTHRWRCSPPSLSAIHRKRNAVGRPHAPHLTQTLPEPLSHPWPPQPRSWARARPRLETIRT